MSIYTQIHIHMYCVFLYVCMYIYIYIYIYMYIYTTVYTHIHTNENDYITMSNSQILGQETDSHEQAYARVTCCMRKRVGTCCYGLTMVSMCPFAGEGFATDKASLRQAAAQCMGVMPWLSLHGCVCVCVCVCVL